MFKCVLGYEYKLQQMYMPRSNIFAELQILDHWTFNGVPTALHAISVNTSLAVSLPTSACVGTASWKSTANPQKQDLSFVGL